MLITVSTIQYRMELSRDGKITGSRFEGYSNLREYIASKKLVIRWLVYFALFFTVLLLAEYGPGFNPADSIYCGIAGLIGFKGDLKGNIGKMNDRMLHRGPDDEGIYISENGKVALGHRRLSIVDLSKKGAQPMMSHSGRKVIAYNGEIYNASVVKDKLIAEGKVTEFNGTSDTEILIEAIDAYGMEETLTMCKGMFGNCRL